MQILKDGLARMVNDLNLNPINLYEYEKRAELILPHDNWDFIAAGAMDELTTQKLCLYANLELIKIVDDLIYLEILLTYWTHRN